MNGTRVLGMRLLLVFAATLAAAVEARAEMSDVDATVRRLIGVDPERMSQQVFYLAEKPLPYRKPNLISPGHEKNTLYEADDYLAGYPAAVINIGSWPYGDPEYHAEGDIPEKCGVKNAALSVQGTLAAALTLDTRGI